MCNSKQSHLTTFLVFFPSLILFMKANINFLLSKYIKYVNVFFTLYFSLLLKILILDYIFRFLFFYYIIYVSISFPNLSHILSLDLFEALGIWATNSCAFFFLGKTILPLLEFFIFIQLFIQNQGLLGIFSVSISNEI